MTHNPVLSIDFESASTVDLRRTGVHTYARHPDTRVLCLSYQFEGEPVQNWTPFSGQPFPMRVLDHVARGRTVQGWNVGFEWVIWNHVLSRIVPGLPSLALAQLSDTMARAAYWGLPLSLDQAGRALGLGVTKDTDGHKLMMQMNKPRRRFADGTFSWWHIDDPTRLDRLVQYCDRDVLVEATIAAQLPPLPKIEQAAWELDQRINARGVVLDTELVDKLMELAAEGRHTADEYMRSLTGRAVYAVTSVSALLAHLKTLGYPYDDLTKETIKRRLEDDACGDLEREILEVRQDAAKTSAAKLNTMLSAGWRDAPGEPTRVRGMLQFYGAFRTGRWAGRLIQLQNLPRGTVKKIDDAIKMALAGAPAPDMEMFFGPVLGIVSSALRGCLVAAPGHQLVVADFSQIEARVVAWLAGQQDILDVFAKGEDVYTYTARQNGSNDRQLGKVLVLACGFGMSSAKFRDTARTYGLNLSEEQAERAVKGWRRSNSKIVQFWYDCDNAARAVIDAADANGNAAPITVGPVQFAMWRGHMLIRLPSGRHLVYRDAKLVPGKFSDKSISYMGVDQYTRQWTRQHTYGGKLVENITQAVARDIMRDATLGADRAGIPVEMLVHDEMICEVETSKAPWALDTLLAIMRTRPAWAPGLPVDGAGWFGPRYKK